jgi:hypothetical protein
MNKKVILKDLTIGFVIGLLTTVMGCFLFLRFYTKYDFLEGVNAIKHEGYLGKLIALSAVLNILIFFLLLKFNKEIMARGVVFATIVLTIITIFV